MMFQLMTSSEYMPLWNKISHVFEQMRKPLNCVLLKSGYRKAVNELCVVLICN